MIPLARPSLSFDEVAPAFDSIISSGTLTRGPYVARFEREVADYVGRPHATATTSATTALHLSLVASGVKPGDEVLLSDFTFPATGNVVCQMGATPVLVDSLPASFELDLEDLERKITRRSRAIIAVDPFGVPAPLPELEEMARRNSLFLIEDAACALGSSIEGRRCGAFGDFGCFSFHPRKLLTTGEGGIVTCADDALSDRITNLSNHGGRREGVGYVFEEAGFNYRMCEFQAAVGVAQMANIDQILMARRKAAALYDLRLRDAPGIGVPHTTARGDFNYQSYVVLLDHRVDRDAVIDAVRAAGVEVTLGTYALHAQPSYQKYGYRGGDLPNAWNHFRSSLTLPLYTGLEESQIARIVEELLRATGRHHRSNGISHHGTPTPQRRKNPTSPLLSP